MGPLLHDDIESSVPELLAPISSPDGISPLKAEGAIIRIRTAIKRYRTSRDALYITATSPSTSTDDLDSIHLTPGIKTDSETLDEIEEVLKSLETTTLDVSENNGVDIETLRPVDVATEARWQSQSPFPLTLQTHPKSFAPYNHHIEDLKAFKDDLMAAKKCSDATKATYTKVEVLLLTWAENDDIKEEVEEEIEGLNKLFSELNYNVTPFAIPNINCQNELQFEVLSFLKNHKLDPSDETLFIVYYTGHGSIRNGSCYWHPTAGAAAPSNRKDRTSAQRGPTVEWAKIQENFETTEQDILFILDCCYAGSAAMHKGASGTKELLAACSSQQETKAGEKSFTIRLVNCIRRMIKEEPVFQVAWLYESMIAASQSPLCLHVKLNKSPTSICLSSLADNAKIDSDTTVYGSTDGHLALPSPSRARSPSSATSTHTPSLFSGRDDDDTTQLSIPDPDPVLPNSWHYQVLLSVKLRANILPKAEDWCLTFPPGQVEGLEDVTFQSLYETKSTLLFLTMPVRQWLLLKDNPAYTFIDFVVGDNLMNTHSQGQNPEPEPQSDIAPVSGTNSDETTSTALGEGDVVGYLLHAMHEFFEKTKTYEDNQVRKPGKIARTCQYIAENLGVPSRLESDPRFAIVQHIVQHLIIDRNDGGDFTGIRYGLQLDVLVERIFETGRKSIKDALHKAKEKDDDLESTITTEFNQLEKDIVKLAKLEGEGLAIKKFTDPAAAEASEIPKSPRKTHTRSRSDGSKWATFDDVVPRNGAGKDSGIGIQRKDSGKIRTESWKSKLGSTRSDSGIAGGNPLEYLKRRFSKEGQKMSSRMPSPRSESHVAFRGTTTV